MVQENLSVTQKDKFMLQAKVSELKNNMKTLLQQNQQLKLDLRRGAAKTVRLPGRRLSRGPGVCGQEAPLPWSFPLKLAFDRH